MRLIRAVGNGRRLPTPPNWNIVDTDSIIDTDSSDEDGIPDDIENPTRPQHAHLIPNGMNIELEEQIYPQNSCIRIINIWVVVRPNGEVVYYEGDLWSDDGWMICMGNDNDDLMTKIQRIVDIGYNDDE